METISSHSVGFHTHIQVSISSENESNSTTHGLSSIRGIRAFCLAFLCNKHAVTLSFGNRLFIYYVYHHNHSFVKYYVVDGAKRLGFSERTNSFEDRRLVFLQKCSCFIISEYLFLKCFTISQNQICATDFSQASVLWKQRWFLYRVYGPQSGRANSNPL